MTRGFMVLRDLLSHFRRPNGRLEISEDIQVRSNVFLTARERGKIVARRESHNVLVNGGRSWLRGLSSALSYGFPAESVPNDVPVVDEKNPSSINANPADPKTNVQQESRFRPRYIAFGVGGILQGITPPGPGLYTEIVTRYGLERPVQYRVHNGNTFYMAQVAGQDLTDELYAPNAYTLRFRHIALETDISFADQPTYGTCVPLSEVALLSSQADANVLIAPAEVPGTVGVLAYNTFSTFSKTPLCQLETVWEWRY